MTRTQIRKAADAMVRDGFDRQQVFDTLMIQGTGMDNEKLARIVRYIPSLVARQRYRPPHAVLLGLLWITAVAKSLYGIGLASEQGWSKIYLALWLPAITIVLSVLIAMYHTRAYHTLAFLTGIGLVKFITRTNWSNFDPWNTIDLVVAVAIIALAWYLFSKMASNYEVSVGADGAKSIVFPPEPGPMTTVP